MQSFNKRKMKETVSLGLHNTASLTDLCTQLSTVKLYVRTMYPSWIILAFHYLIGKEITAEIKIYGDHVFEWITSVNDI